MDNVDLKKEGLEAPEIQNVMKVCIDLASTKEEQINTACNEFYNYGKTFIQDLQPAEVLKKAVGEITTLRTPCGQGTKTWSRYKIFVFLRKFILVGTHDQLEKTVQFLKNFPSVEINLKIQN